ncbi:MAG: putative iron export permease protein FetB [Candidatus Erwinia impunctatus]|nr:putative iron export permease protein FetB [Culicoides impunctatus]
MNQPVISDTSLALTLLLVLIALSLSWKEKLGLEKEMIWSVVRATLQLLLVGYLLQSLFKVNNVWLTLSMVLFICVNAALNARKRSRQKRYAFSIALVAIGFSTAVTLTILIGSGALAFSPVQIIPVTGMIAGNAMVATGLCFTHLYQRLVNNQQKVMEMLSLGASVKIALSPPLRQSIRAAMIPTVDAAKTVGLVSLPGMMSGLIFAGVDPVKAIKYQIMVTFMLLGTAAVSTLIAGYLSCRQYVNRRAQLRLDE